MLTDDELTNYLDELGVLNEEKQGKGIDENRALFHELVTQILETEKNKPSEVTLPKELPTHKNKVKKRNYLPLILFVTGCFLSGVASGFFLGSLHRAPLTKMHYELKQIAEKLNSPISKEEIIEPIKPTEKGFR